MPPAHALDSYVIRSSVWFCNDTPERIDYHIKNDDYLPLLATMVGFMEEALRVNDSSEVNDRKTELALSLAKELRDDLRYVGAHYALVKRGPGEELDVRSGNVLS
jgi:hypothetical protein